MFNEYVSLSQELQQKLEEKEHPTSVVTESNYYFNQKDRLPTPALLDIKSSFGPNSFHSDSMIYHDDQTELTIPKVQEKAKLQQNLNEIENDETFDINLSTHYEESFSNSVTGSITDSFNDSTLIKVNDIGIEDDEMNNTSTDTENMDRQINQLCANSVSELDTSVFAGGHSYQVPSSLATVRGMSDKNTSQEIPLNDPLPLIEHEINFVMNHESPQLESPLATPFHKRFSSMDIRENSPLLSEHDSILDSNKKLHNFIQLSEQRSISSYLNNHAVHYGCASVIFEYQHEIFIGTELGWIFVFSNDTGKALNQFQSNCYVPGKRSEISNLVLSPNGEYLVCASSNGKIALYKRHEKEAPSSFKFIKVIGSFNDRISSLVFFSNSSFVACDRKSVKSFRIKRSLFSQSISGKTVINNESGEIQNVAILGRKLRDSITICAIATSKFLIIATLTPSVRVLYSTSIKSLFSVDQDYAQLLKPNVHSSPSGHYIKTPSVVISWKLEDQQHKAKHHVLAVALKNTVNFYRLQRINHKIDLIHIGIEHVSFPIRQISWYSKDMLLALSVDQMAAILPSANMVIDELILSASWPLQISSNLLLCSYSLYNIRILSWIDKVNKLISGKQWYKGFDLLVMFYHNPNHGTIDLDGSLEERKYIISEKMSSHILSFCQDNMSNSTFFANETIRRTTERCLSYLAQVNAIETIFVSMVDLYEKNNQLNVYNDSMEYLLKNSSMNMLEVPPSFIRRVITNYDQKPQNHETYKEFESFMLNLKLFHLPVQDIHSIYLRSLYFYLPQLTMNMLAIKFDYIAPIRHFVHFISMDGLDHDNVNLLEYFEKEHQIHLKNPPYLEQLYSTHELFEFVFAYIEQLIQGKCFLHAIPLAELKCIKGDLLKFIFCHQLSQDAIVFDFFMNHDSNRFMLILKTFFVDDTPTSPWKRFSEKTILSSTSALINPNIAEKLDDDDETSMMKPIYSESTFQKRSLSTPAKLRGSFNYLDRSHIAVFMNARLQNPLSDITPNNINNSISSEIPFSFQNSFDPMMTPNINLSPIQMHPIPPQTTPSKFHFDVEQLRRIKIDTYLFLLEFCAKGTILCDKEFLFHMIDYFIEEKDDPLITPQKRVVLQQCMVFIFERYEMTEAERLLLVSKCTRGRYYLACSQLHCQLGDLANCLDCLIRESRLVKHYNFVFTNIKRLISDAEASDKYKVLCDAVIDQMPALMELSKENGKALLAHLFQLT